MNYPFETERLILRPFELEDLQNLQAYLNSPELIGRRYIPWKFSTDIPLSKNQVEGVLKTWTEAEKQFHLAIILREDSKLMGHVNASWGWDPHCPNLDLVISPTYQRQGYGSEVLTAMLAYFFNNTPAHNITGGMASWNQQAQDFAVRHGFTRIGCFRRTGFREGQYVDWMGMDILRPEWLARSRKGGA